MGGMNVMFATNRGRELYHIPWQKMELYVCRHLIHEKIQEKRTAENKEGLHIHS